MWALRALGRRGIRATKWQAGTEMEADGLYGSKKYGQGIAQNHFHTPWHDRWPITDQSVCREEQTGATSEAGAIIGTRVGQDWG